MPVCVLLSELLHSFRFLSFCLYLLLVVGSCALFVIVVVVFICFFFCFFARSLAFALCYNSMTAVITFNRVYNLYDYLLPQQYDSDQSTTLCRPNPSRYRFMYALLFFVKCFVVHVLSSSEYRRSLSVWQGLLFCFCCRCSDLHLMLSSGSSQTKFLRVINYGIISFCKVFFFAKF